MARGSVTLINRAMARPLTVLGTEKPLLILAVLLSFPLVMATRLHFPAVLIGVVVFGCLHRVMVTVTKHDPHLAKLFKRSTRYCLQTYYPAKSHPLMVSPLPIKTVARP